MSDLKVLAAKHCLGIMGKKIASTHRFHDGKMYEVTILHCEDMPIVQVKSTQHDGYNAVQASYGSKKQRGKAITGHFKSIEAKGNLTEFRSDEVSDDLKQITLEVLQGVHSVKVTAKTKGKGFAGPVKRWGFKMQDATHGNSLSHRAHGSTGQCQDPGRVFKGKKMAGRMGHTNVTVKNLAIHMIDRDNNLIYIRGCVPGSVGTFVKILPYMLNNDGGK